MDRTSNGKHIVAVATACAIWGGSVIGTKLTYDSLAPMQLGLLRFTLSTCVFFVLLALRRQLAAPRGRELALIAASGLLGTSLYFAAENLGTSLVSAGTASLVIGSFPAMTLVLESALDRTLPRPRVAVGIMLAFAGVCVLALAEGLTSGPSELLGIGVLMAGGLCWGIYNIMMRSLAGGLSTLAITAWQTLFGALGFVPLALLEGAQVHPLSAVALGSLGYLVLGCTVAGFTLYNYGFEELSPTVVASLVNLVPVIGVVLSAVILGEHVTTAQVVGGAVVVAGIMLSSLPESS